MRLDDLRPTSNVDDRRGRSGGRRMAVGGGGIGIIVIAVIVMLAGGDPTTILQNLATDPGSQSQTQPQSGSRTDDAAFDLSRKIIGSTEDVWTQILARRGITYQPAVFTPYDNATQTGCGQGEVMMGPFYCPADRHVYIDLSFFNELATRFGAPGQFAQAYVLAHEIGHHVQHILGTMDQAQTQFGNGASRKGATSTSVRLELQADCYAGVWAYNANSQFNILEQGDAERGLAAANAVGDDTLQRQTQGRAVPDSFTHGTSAQRVRWFQRGMRTGDMDQCDTFNAPAGTL